MAKSSHAERRLTRAWRRIFADVAEFLDQLGHVDARGADRSAWGRDKFVWPAVNGSRHVDRAMRDANESAPQSREELSKSVVAHRAAVVCYTANYAAMAKRSSASIFFSMMMILRPS